MPSTKKNTTSGSIDNDLESATIFELLSDDRRRYALHYLVQTVGAVHVSDLADQIALWEGEHTHDRYERICTGLFHSHLPRLVDAGVVRYDAERETVEPRESVDQIRPYLDLDSTRIQ